jgi:undecaprenyl-diphosphatase
MDNIIFGWLNGLAGNPTLDSLADAIADDWIYTGVLQLVFFWFFWFETTSDPGRRATLLRGLVGILAAIIVARALSHIFPFRPRPFLSSLMHPTTIPHVAFDQASSFPSDTTAYFVAFGTALWFVSRRVGIALMIYAMTVATLPRIYLGLHYPSDCVAGWLIGIGVPVAVMRSVPDAIVARVIVWTEKEPGVFFALLFAMTAEMSNAFRDVRATLHGLAWVTQIWRELPAIMVAVAASAAVLVIGVFALRTLNSRRQRESEKTARAH